ncbi:hypothetical protein JCM11491_006338 [Sporobolomyces phaffii]
MSSRPPRPPACTYPDDFSLLTSFSYRPHADEVPLDRHVARLERAHRVLADRVPASWCAATDPVSNETVSTAITDALRGVETDQRVRVTLRPPRGEPFVECFPLTRMPSYPVKLVLDDRPTEYRDDPFLSVKTTHRMKYDAARARRGATLEPSDAPRARPFDVILYNERNEVTETSISNIAFDFTSSSSSSSSGTEGTQWVTPPGASGLLAGVERRALLESGQLTERVVTVEQVVRAAKDGTLNVICFNGVRGVFPAFVEV